MASTGDSSRAETPFTFSGLDEYVGGLLYCFRKTRGCGALPVSRYLSRGDDGDDCSATLSTDFKAKTTREHDNAGDKVVMCKGEGNSSC